ncbi:uncharacterized protein BDV17DRAFT_261762 [Aspergillus undulatus]|uniref:uncharacterized protein n=1 Tax=Aspergillus undulatus TaxID=1810928 RepID=UPI003CCDE561
MDESFFSSGHNKSYNSDEEQLLITLKFSGFSWRVIEAEYNRRVPVDRQRTASALENKWRQLSALLCIHIPEQ